MGASDNILEPEGGWNALYVDGEWEEAGDRETIENLNPATQESFGEVPSGTADDVDRAYDVAAETQESWAEQLPQERSRVIADALQWIEDHREEIYELLAVEGGSSRLKGTIEMDTATGLMQVATNYPFRASGDYKDSIVPGKENLVKREPQGVVGVISPWNFPFHLSMRAVAPAIALGNTVVLKPASSTPITGGLLLGHIFDEVGLQSGVFNVVTGPGSEVGGRIASNPTADVVAFTGSTEVGTGVAESAAAHLAHPALELGGNNAHIVTDDADVEQAVEAGAFGSFVHQGHECISVNRHMVHEAIYDEYVDRLAERAESLPAGDPLDEETVVGPVIHEEQLENILSDIQITVDEGAELVTGGEHEGLFLEPTVLSGVTNEMTSAQEEHFGPVAPVIPFETDEEAVEMANDTEYGLSGSVHSSNIGRAWDIADAIDTGMVHINDQPMNDEPHVPFGGVKQSGMGRHNSDQIMQEMTELKWISVQREPREYPL